MPPTQTTALKMCRISAIVAIATVPATVQLP
jgi:hypothetical protein